jgi:AmmeMemoRadiSam system protein B
LDDFQLIPIVMGEHSRDNIETLAQGLSSILQGKNALIVASSDLSHFYNADKAESMDKIVEEKVAEFDANGLFTELQNGRCEMCGGGPVVSLMRTCELMGAKNARVLMYRHSGEVTNDRSEVVGYLSALFYE